MSLSTGPRPAIDERRVEDPADVAAVDHLPEPVALDPVDDLLMRHRRRRGRVWVQVASYLVTVFVLITFNFALPRMMPGDPIQALFIQGNPNYPQNERTRAKLEEYYHLDGSIPEQYGHYLSGLARGDFGTSIVYNRPVREQLFAYIPWTILLVVSGTLVSIVIGLPAGIHSAWKRGRRTDKGLLAAFMLWENIPIFILGTLFFFVFSVELGLFPLGGGVTPLNEFGFWGRIGDVASHLFLPALTMGSLAASWNFLLMRSAMVSELGADYLLVGRAKGLRDRRLKYRYAGRNALLPVVTSLGVQVAMGVTAVIFVERIFAYPGIGTYMFSAIGDQDFPVLQATFLLLTLAVVTLNLVVDLLYRRVDPRTVT